ncbi:MAG: chorismate transformation enzyme, FkbO/Hyg5 family, partial [Planctomycetota bacterium]
YLYQPPVHGNPLAAEMWAFGNGTAVMQGDNLSVARSDDLEWAFLGGQETGNGDEIPDGVPRMLSQARAQLADAGFPFSGLVRTWYYIGSILGAGEDGPRYEEFNQARNRFYRSTWRDLCSSPASTGIGTRESRVALEWMVLGPQRREAEATWIDNPLQAKPYQYRNGMEKNHKPSFSRGVGLRLPGAAVILVSGTASIRNSEVLGKGDPRAQTETTIENIATLIGRHNLMDGYGFSRGATLADIQQYRVYVKRPGDVDAIRDVCRQRLPDVPSAYVEADVCYPDCLVEIEAVAAFKESGNGR